MAAWCSLELMSDNIEARRSWAAALPQLVDDLSRRWSLDVGRPFQSGVASWVAPAGNTRGDRLVLKVAWPHEEAMHEAEGLLAWQGEGTVRLHDTLVVRGTRALLLEACEPGTMLSDRLPAPQQDVVVAGLLRRLWAVPTVHHPFRPLRQMCDLWADEFDDKYACAHALHVDPGLARAGMELFRELPRTAETALLCTDLHAQNVLAATREPWLVIDPKPYVGDPAYDALQHMLNFPDRLLADAEGFCRRMAGLLELDPNRLRQWLFARCVQESVDRPELGRVARDLAP